MRPIIFILFLFFHVAVNAEGTEKPHHLSVLFGGTHLLNEDRTGETIGLDYEYRVSNLLGVGVVAEHAFQDVDSTTVLAVADIHTDFGLIFQVGPGVEFTGDDEEDDLFIFRLGALYEVEFEDFTVSPQFHIDFANDADDSLIFGLAIGKHF